MAKSKNNDVLTFETPEDFVEAYKEAIRSEV